MKVTDEFVHCGLGYSSQRRGMVVVENNAIGSQPIQLDSQQRLASKVSEAANQSLTSLDRQLILEEATRHEKPDKVAKNVHMIKTMQTISKYMNKDPSDSKYFNQNDDKALQIY